RLVEIGGTSPVSAEDIPNRACYMALGHLHRHQKLKGDCPVYYSGSPLPMTFKEAEYEQQVLLLDVSPEAEVTVSPLPIPRFRSLKRIQGDFDKIMAVAEGDDWTGTLIEVTLDLKEPQVGLSDRIRQAFAERGGEVALVQARFVSDINGERLPPEELMTQSPESVFRQFYEQKLGEIASTDDENRFGKLETTFAELIKLWHTEQENSGGERGDK
ncbi:exonuclease SbcCD subunit D C-terminal domain-containing protein, partial [bacterium]|nr:exonuclease SbcCD subunit D C-terminal domain-containing protein [bacterium]